MTTFSRIQAKLLACRVLPHADVRLCQALGLPAELAPKERTQSLAFITCDQDDTLYAALDHATKMARVSVLYARSFYAGSAHASGPLSGEVLGVLAARDPDELHNGVIAVQRAIDELFAFFSLGEQRATVFPTVIPSVGHYLAPLAGIAVGEPLGYFIAPPAEALIGLDAALKAADVSLQKFFGPPSETNFAGAYVSGRLDAVQAAADAFIAACADVAAHPHRR